MSCTTVVTIKEDTVSASLNNIQIASVKGSDYGKGLYVVGDTGPAGGIVFYDAGSTQTSTYKDSEGNDVTYTWRYLEAAPSTYKDDAFFGYYYKEYSNTLSAIIASDNTAIGTGRSNTRTIVNTLGELACNSSSSYSQKSGSYAALVCDNYSVEYNGVTYDDWFLPSKDELNELYRVNKGENMIRYPWPQYSTSSESSETDIWCQNFSNGSQNSNFSRDTKYHILPIRAFL